MRKLFRKSGGDPPKRDFIPVEGKKSLREIEGGDPRRYEAYAKK